MDVQFRWHLGPMEEEEVHPHPAAAKPPSLGQASVLWERPAGGEPRLGKQFRKPWFHSSPLSTHAHATRTRARWLSRPPSNTSAALQGQSQTVGNNHRPQASGALTAVSQSGNLRFQSHPLKKTAGQISANPSLPQLASEVSKLQVSCECRPTQEPKTLWMVVCLFVFSIKEKRNLKCKVRTLHTTSRHHVKVQDLPGKNRHCRRAWEPRYEPGNPTNQVSLALVTLRRMPEPWDGAFGTLEGCFLWQCPPA